MEIQLGATDESHVIRTIEYWDIERRRYPQYEHTAVIVAEDVTGRFLNVIRLFNGVIPLIAIKLQALHIGDQLCLVFSTIVDELPLAVIDDDEETREVADRNYWEQRGSVATVQLADRILELINTFAPGFELKPNKYYVGVACEGRRSTPRCSPKETNASRRDKGSSRGGDDDATGRVGTHLVDYGASRQAYWIDLKAEDIEAEKDLLIELMKRAYEARA